MGMKRFNLSSDIMFSLVMSEPERCRELLEMILGFEIERVEVTSQLPLKPGILQKGVRLDIFAKDPENTRYNVEMQTGILKHFGKRLRMGSLFVA